jgi:tetratricopeptide (TPR) repeat protein
MDQYQSLLVQKQIRDNSKSINEYYKDLMQWQKEIAQKDKLIKDNFKGKENFYNEEQNDDISKNAEIKEKLKRDVNSIKDYYNHWDKFNVDEELNIIDKDKDSNSKLKKMIANEKSTAKLNAQVTITSNRILSNEGCINKMKNEANAYFAIKNYNKSIELYNSVLSLIEKENNSKYDKMRIVVLNNKGNSYLKLSLYKEAINEFDKVVKEDNENFKAFFRRGICYLKLEQPVNGLRDLQESLKYIRGDCENDKKIIEENIDECIKNINTIISKERTRLGKFEYSDNVNFNKVKIYEMNLDENKDIVIGKSVKKIKEEPKLEKTNNKPTNVALKEEEIIKFVYDITKENLTSSSFKYGLRNLKSITEKEEYLSVTINNSANKSNISSENICQ